MMFSLDRYYKGVLLGCTIFLSALMLIMVQPTRSTPMMPATWTVNTVDDPGAPTCAVTCSLRTAVNAAAPGDLIVFDASIFSVPQTIMLNGQIEISQPLMIDGVAGGGIAPDLSGNHLTRTFQVDTGATVTLKALNIVGGQAPSGGGIYNSGWLTITDSTLRENATDDGIMDPVGGGGEGGGAGGGIFNSGTLFLTNSIIRQNQTGKGGRGRPAGTGGSGGGIFNSGTLTITNSQVSENRAGDGGQSWSCGFFGHGGSGGGIYNAGMLYIINSTLSQNKAGNGSGNGMEICTYGGFGGGGGAIASGGTLSITNSTLNGNKTGSGGDSAVFAFGYGFCVRYGGNAGGGGAISGGTITIMNSTLSENATGDGGDGNCGGSGGPGGAISSGGTLSIINSTLNGNRTGSGGSGSADSQPGGGAGDGGAISGGTITIMNSTLSGNMTGNGGDGHSGSSGGNGGNGGGVRGYATLFITNSTLSGNTTGSGGDGYNGGNGGNGGDGGGVMNSGSLSMTNGTIVGNKAGDGGLGYTGGAGGSGGGIFSVQAVSLTNSTLGENATGIGAWSYYTTGVNGSGAGIRWQGTALIMNSIIANGPSEDNCAAASFQADGGYNLDSGDTCGFTTTNHSLVSTDPLLGMLGDYGGPVQTVPLLGGSPAMDAIPLGDNGCGTTITTDARGVPRPQGAACDIGAYEEYYYGLSLTPSAAGLLGLPGSIVTYTLTVTNTAHTYDTVTVTVAGNTFVTAAPASIGPLAAGAGTTFGVAVTIPGGASAGSHDTANIQVTSQGDPTKLATAVLTTTVSFPVYLPLIIKQP